MQSPSMYTPDAVVAAGPFAQWLAQARAALRGNGGMAVPCGDCVGCCTSAYSIRIRPHDAALEIIPAQFLSSVPGLAYPHAQLNPLQDGACPLFKAGRCSIYAQRPQTCLDYDCRVFAAAGIAVGADKPVINQRIRAWRFSYACEADRQAHAAVQAAAAFIADHSSMFPTGYVSARPAHIAVLAIKVYAVFLAAAIRTKTDADIAGAILHASREFDAGKHSDADA